jgi:hypothetical protein
MMIMLVIGRKHKYHKTVKLCLMVVKTMVNVEKNKYCIYSCLVTRMQDKTIKGT